MKATNIRTAKCVLSAFLVLALSVWGFDFSALSKAYAEEPGDNAALVTNDSVYGIFRDGNGVIRGTYYYEDEYFNQDAFTYSPDLATLSMMVEMESFGEDDSAYETRPERLKALLENMNFHDFEANQGYVERPTHNSIGVGIANKTITDENGNPRTLIAVIVRGGNYGSEWGGNTILGKGGEAQGFEAARNQVVHFLADYLKNHQDDITQQPKFWVVGFSRGSATANLTGNYINYAIEHVDDAEVPMTSIGNPLEYDATVANRQIENKASMEALVEAFRIVRPQTKDLYCYGFEVPQGGVGEDIQLDGSFSTPNGYFAKETRNLFCLVNDEDLVTKVAPSAMYFGRYGTDVNLTENISTEALTHQFSLLDPASSNAWVKRPIVKDGFKVYTIGLEDLFKYLTDKSDAFYSAVDGGSNKLGKEVTSLPAYLDELMSFCTQLIEFGSSSYADGLQTWAEPLAAIVRDGRGDRVMDVAVNSFKNSFDWHYLSKVILNVGLSEDGVRARTFVSRYVRSYLIRVINAWERDPECAKEFEPGELQRMRETASSVAEFASDFVVQDYFRYDLQHAATAIVYGPALFDTHDTNNVLAYLRANDDHYKQVFEADRWFQQHILTVTPTQKDENGVLKLAEGTTIEVKRGSTLLATVTPDGLVYASDDVRGKIGYRVTPEGVITVTVMTLNHFDEGYVEFALTTTETDAVSLDYRNEFFDENASGVSSDSVDPTQEWEHKQLAISSIVPATVRCFRNKPEAQLFWTAAFKVEHAVYRAEFDDYMGLSYDSEKAADLVVKRADGNAITTASDRVYKVDADEVVTVSAGKIENYWSGSRTYDLVPVAMYAATMKKRGIYTLEEKIADKSADGRVIGEIDMAQHTGDGLYVIVMAEDAQTVEVPTANDGLIYNGDAQEGIGEGEGYVFAKGSVRSAVDAGTYTAKVKPDEGYVWPDGSVSERSIEWKIAKAPQAPLTVQCKDGDEIANSASVGSQLSLSATGGSGDGEVTYRAVGYASQGAATIDGDVLTAGSPGVVAVTATKAASANYEEVTSAPAYVSILEAEPDQGGIYVDWDSDFFAYSKDDPEASTDAIVNAVLTAEEQESTGVQEKKTIFLNLSGKAVGTVSSADKNAFTARVRNAGGEDKNWRFGSMYQLDVLKTTLHYEGQQLKYDGEEQVATTQDSLAVQLAIPDSLQNTNESIERTYKVVVRSEGEYGVITPQLSADGAHLLLSSDSFDEFAICYYDCEIVEKPTAKTGLKYNGSEQTGVVQASDAYVLEGDVSAVDAGSYTAVAKLDEDCMWSDGTDGDCEISWSIAKAPQNYLSIAAASSLKVGQSIQLSAVGGTGTGAVTFSIESPGQGTATINGDVLTATAPGTVVVRATKAGDANHGEVTSLPFEVSILEVNPEGAVAIITDDQVLSDNAAIRNAVLTEADIEAYQSGDYITVAITVDDVTEAADSDTKADIDEVAKADGYAVGQYLDINITKTTYEYSEGHIVGSRDDSVTETFAPIDFSLNVPEALVNTDPAVSRAYAVIARHVDATGAVQTEMVDGVSYDDDAHTLAFSASKFSVYAIAYKDTANPNPTPKPDPAPTPDPTPAPAPSDSEDTPTPTKKTVIPATGDGNGLVVGVLVMLMLASASLVVVSRRR